MVKCGTIGTLTLVTVIGVMCESNVNPAVGQETGWCGTPTAQGRPDPPPVGTCHLGPCDDPDLRNASIPDESSGWLTIRIKFNIFPSMYVITPTKVSAEMTDITDHFDNSWIKFEYDAEWINDPDYSTIESHTEANNMKSEYADEPSHQLNVYVTDIEMGGLVAWAYFPWWDQATSAPGGVVIDKDEFGRGVVPEQETKILSHELGHILGLWHSFHGSRKQELEYYHGGCLGPDPYGQGCSCVCYESPHPLDPEAGDEVGDMCGDTPAAPLITDCDAPTWEDPCSWEFWQAVIDSNHMSYQEEGYCRTHFSLQQRGRMRCWTSNVLGGWMVGESTGACCLPDGSCLESVETWCDDVEGTYVGAGTTCGQEGACCMGNGGCQYNVAETCCVEGGGTFLGPEGYCEAGEEHACCLDDGTCIDTTEQCCQAWEGWYRPTKTCATLPLPCPSENK